MHCSNALNNSDSDSYVDIVQAKRSRLGKEAKAAGRDTKGSTSCAVSAPAYSEAGSGDDLDGEYNEDDQADPNKAERVGGRRTRQASVQLEPAWLQLEELEETPSKHKSKRKASRSSSAAQTHHQHAAGMSTTYCQLLINLVLSPNDLQTFDLCLCPCQQACIFLNRQCCMHLLGWSPRPAPCHSAVPHVCRTKRRPLQPQR